MTLWQRMIFLQKIPAFSAIDAGRLALIAGVCRERSYASGETVFPAGGRPDRLPLPVAGHLVDASGRTLPVPCCVDLLLFESEAESGAVLAGPEGADCLTIGRSHLFTILGECPELSLGLLEGRQK